MNALPILAIMLLLLSPFVAVPQPEYTCQYTYGGDVSDYTDCNYRYLTLSHAIFEFNVMQKDLAEFKYYVSAITIGSGLLSGHLVVNDTTQTLEVVV